MEEQYLQLLKNVLENGVSSNDRTGVGTKRLFGQTLRFDLTKGFPLLTTKKMSWKSIAHELLWFISGDTNLNYLNANGVKIWNANQQDYVKRRNQAGLPTVEGDCGAIYGYQWRKFNDGFIGEIDQIKNLCDEIKNNPTSRRLLVSAWNPLQVDPLSACLPPCHYAFQFGINNNELTCMFNMRSTDLFLGLPYNIASYALLTHLFAKAYDLIPKEVIYVGFDCHIYNNHIDQVKEQICRKPYEFPTINIRNKKDVLDFNIDDIEILNYMHHPTIKAEMAV